LHLNATTNPKPNLNTIPNPNFKTNPDSPRMIMTPIVLDFSHFSCN